MDRRDGGDSGDFESAGVTPAFHRGAADVFRLLSRTPFAGETAETVDRDRTLWQTIAAVAEVAGR